MVSMPVGAAPGPGALLNKDKVHEKSSYEKAFGELYEHLGRRYPNFAMKGIDWKKVGQEMLPLAAGVKSDEEFGVLCLKLVARLEDSHAEVLAALAKVPVIPMPQWDVGIACLIDDRDRAVVFYVEKGSPAEGVGVRPGMAVVSVNGKAAAEVLEGAHEAAGDVLGVFERAAAAAFGGADVSSADGSRGEGEARAGGC
jgi:predicted metalloprotease with PDZ domain